MSVNPLLYYSSILISLAPDFVGTISIGKTPRHVLFICSIQVAMTEPRQADLKMLIEEAGAVRELQQSSYRWNSLKDKLN